MATETGDVDWLDDTEVENFKTFCQQATEAQLRVIYWREMNAGRKGFAKLARWTAEARGVALE